MRQLSIFSPRNQAIATLSPGIIDSLAIAAITGYQRYLSPYKGFRCAHRVLHQGESCSQYSANCLSSVDCASCDLAGLDCSGLDACGGCSW